MQISKPVKCSRRPGTGSQQYSKEGGVSLMLPVEVTSKSLYETSAVSLFTHLPTPTLLAACGIAALKSRSQSRLHVYLFCVLSLGFSRKRETTRSLKARPHALLFTISVWVLLRPLLTITSKMQEKRPTVYSPYPRRPERLTICRCNYKGSTFSSVILRP